MSTTVTYNGVTFSAVKFDIAAEPVYDTGDQSTSFNRHVLRVTGVMQADASPLASKIVTARTALLAPRANLTVSIDGSNVFNVTAPDDNDGPKPRRCDFTEFVGSQFAVIVWECEVGIADCNSTAKNIASHRYAVEHNIDAKGLTTRTITGTLRVREAASDNNPDALRGVVTPRIPDGFRRDTARFMVGLDGMTLDYQIVDKEVFLVAPDPASIARGTYTEMMGDGYLWFKQFTLELEGSKNALKSELFALGITILKSKIDFSFDLVIQASFQEELYDCTVRMSVVAQASTTQSGEQGMYPNPSMLFTTPPGSESNKNIDLGPYGTAMVAAAKQAFYVNCDDTAAPADFTTGNDGQSSGTDVTVEAKPDDTSPSTNTTATKFNQKQVDNSYMLYEDVCTISEQTGIVELPTTSRPGGATVYQVHDPITIIRQRGRAVRKGGTPDLGQPLTMAYGSSYIKKRDIITSAPQLMPDKKTWVYTLAWDYEIVCVSGTTDYYEDSAPDSEVGTVVEYTGPISLSFPTNAVSSDTFTDIITLANHRISEPLTET